MDMGTVSDGKRGGASPGRTNLKPAFWLYYKYCYNYNVDIGMVLVVVANCIMIVVVFFLVITWQSCCRQLGSLNKAQDRREITIQRADDKAFVKSLQDQVQNWMQVRYCHTWHQL